MQVTSLVLLTDDAFANEGLHQRLIAGDVEVSAKAVKSALDTFMDDVHPQAHGVHHRYPSQRIEGDLGFHRFVVLKRCGGVIRVRILVVNEEEASVAMASDEFLVIVEAEALVAQLRHLGG